MVLLPRVQMQHRVDQSGTALSFTAHLAAGSVAASWLWPWPWPWPQLILRLRLILWLRL